MNYQKLSDKQKQELLMEMLITLYLRLLLVAMAIPALHHSRPYQWFLQKTKVGKPLSCPQCLTTWTTLVVALTYWAYPVPEAILMSLGSGFMANELDKIHTKIF